jgi:hypothetical protein
MHNSDEDKYNRFLNKIRLLGLYEWDDPYISANLAVWLTNFHEDHKKYALELLSNFMYYNGDTIKSLLQYLFWDKLLYPCVEDRDDNSQTDLNDLLTTKLKRTRFIGIGNPSESGAYLLYFFRQVNNIPLELFIHSFELFEEQNSDSFDTVIFLDDFSGSGTSINKYFNKLLKVNGKTKYLKSMSNFDVKVYTLFSTTEAIQKVQKNKDKFSINSIESVVQLDDTYKVFGKNSRYFEDLLREELEVIFREYGTKLSGGDSNSLGYSDGQLLLGFSHNIPNNTLPIIWSEKDNWIPIFKRYAKIYEGFKW